MTHTPPTTEFVTASHLARLVERSSDVVRYDVRCGRLVPAARTAQGAALFTKEQAEKWAADRKRQKAEPAHAAVA